MFLEVSVGPNLLKTKIKIVSRYRISASVPRVYHGCSTDVLETTNVSLAIQGETVVI